MGGDFCLSFVGIKKGADPDWSAADEMIEKMKETHLSEWRETFKDIQDLEHLFHSLDIPLDGYSSKDEPDMNDRVSGCDKIRECLNAVRRAWDDGTRDSTIIQIQEVDYLFSGGMSWGDPPTDMYVQINMFIESGLAKAAKFEF